MNMKNRILIILVTNFNLKMYKKDETYPFLINFDCNIAHFKTKPFYHYNTHLMINLRVRRVLVETFGPALCRISNIERKHNQYFVIAVIVVYKVQCNINALLVYSFLKYKCKFVLFLFYRCLGHRSFILSLV